MKEKYIDSFYDFNNRSFASKVVFRKNENRDIGACIGIPHGGEILLSQESIQRISRINNLHFIAEGNAAKNPSAEPGMMRFINKFFPNYSIEEESWDEIAESLEKGVGNPEFNICYVFMQHEYNNYIDYYTWDKGTMLDALAKTTKPEFPPNSPHDTLEREKWLKYHMRRAGFLSSLQKPFNREKLFHLLTQMEETVYPPGQQVPNTDTYFGKMQQKIEEERNSIIYHLMETGAVCIAGEGHIDELILQFPDLYIEK